MKKVIMYLLAASLMITAALSLNSCKKTETDEDVPVDEVIITDRASFACPICGFIIYTNEPVHTHEYFVPETCPLGEYDPLTNTGCFWFHKAHHIHRYQLIGNGNLIWENEHLGGGGY